MASSYNRGSGSGAVGVYKDIVDDLFYVTKREAPLMDSAKSVQASDNTHYWESVVFGAFTSNPYKRAESASLSTTYTPNTKTEYSNIVEESAIPFDVSTRAYFIAKNKGYAGIKDMWATARTEADIELKDACEWSLLNGTPSASATYSMQGLIPMATTYGTTSYTTTATFAFPTAGEANFRTMLNTMRGAGGVRGRKKVCLTSYTNKDSIGKSWNGNATQTQQLAEDAKKYADIKFYVSQFGVVAIMGHDMCASTNLVVYDAEDLAIAWLYKTQTIDLAVSSLVKGNAARANAMTLQYKNPTTLGWMSIS